MRLLGVEAWRGFGYGSQLWLTSLGKVGVFPPARFGPAFFPDIIGGGLHKRLCRIGDPNMRSGDQLETTVAPTLSQKATPTRRLFSPAHLTAVG